MTEQYRNNYFKLVAVIVEIAFIVIWKYVREKLLGPDSFNTFLNKEKHKLVHVHETSPCCECMTKHIHGERLISGKQLLILYKSDERKQIRDHIKYTVNKLTQICICKYSAKENIDVRVFDITLANYIIQKCGKHELGIDNWIEQIMEVRNEIFHLSDIQEMTDQVFSRRWSKLEGSIMGIANHIGSAFAVVIDQNIMQTKKLTIVGDYMLTYEIICRDYWKNKCAEFERAQSQVVEEKSAALHHTMPQWFSRSMGKYCQKTMRKIETFNTMVDNTNLMINIFGIEEKVEKCYATEKVKEGLPETNEEKAMKRIDGKPIINNKFAHFQSCSQCGRKLPNMIQGRMNLVEPGANKVIVLNAETTINNTEKTNGNMLDSVHINMSQNTWAKEVAVESFDALAHILENVFLSISASQNTIPSICVNYSPTSTEHTTNDRDIFAKTDLQVKHKNIVSKTRNKILLYLYLLITFGTQLLSSLKSAYFSNFTSDLFLEAFLNGDLISRILKRITNKASIHNDTTPANDSIVKTYWFIKSEYAFCSNSYQRINGHIDANYKQTTINDGLQRNTKSLKVTSRSWILTFTLYFVVLGLLQSASCEEIKVTWSMKSNVTIFGKTAELECLISDLNNLCNRTLRQWYGGKPYGFLCRNGACRNQAKYLEQKDSMCKYTLEISNFSENDVNCEYTCSYGVHRSRKMLKLDEEHFAYIPSMNDVKYKVNADMDMLNASILIPKAFPKPACQALFAGKTISTISNITSTGELYRTEISVVFKPLVNMCKGVLDISCMIGSSKFTPLYQNITVCKGVSDRTNQHTESNAVLYVVVVVVLLVTFVLIVTLCLSKHVHKRLIQLMYHRTPTSENNIPAVM